MNLRLALLELWQPRFFREQVIRELFTATARGFGRPLPDLDRFSLTALEQEYARFSRDTAESLDPNCQAGTDSRLFEQARVLGTRFRRQMRIRSAAEVMTAARILYRVIGIDISGNSSGQVLVRSCAFSRVYSGPVCRIMGALDSGLFAGLAPGQRLHFTQRLTEGSDCCRARLVPAR